RFTCTVHSPVGQDPADYGINLQPLPPISFAKNDVAFIDPTGVDHDLLGQGLKKAIYNYMHGIGLEEDVRNWFDLPRGQVPKPSVPKQKIARALGFI
ncbi:MAG: radical SAM protein, partial [Rhodocyclales bacterium]|nr:radical SAM protein [Rhodocyclales bacterium]